MRREPGFPLLRSMFPEPRSSPRNPILPDMSPGDLLEAALLRLPDDVWRRGANSVNISTGPSGLPTTGDPVVDEWERQLAAGEYDDDE